jgi:hypothetical protein
MTTTNTAASLANVDSTTYVAVCWGPELADRMEWVGEYAVDRALREYRRMIVPAGLWVGSELVHGQDMTVVNEEPEEPIVHRTRTVASSSLSRHWAAKPSGRALGWRPDSSHVTAACTCGWSRVGSDRASMRQVAQRHRKNPEE